MAVLGKAERQSLAAASVNAAAIEAEIERIQTLKLDEVRIGKLTSFGLSKHHQYRHLDEQRIHRWIRCGTSQKRGRGNTM
jgi:hypothetical protein